MFVPCPIFDLSLPNSGPSAAQTPSLNFERVYELTCCFFRTRRRIEGSLLGTFQSNAEEFEGLALQGGGPGDDVEGFGAGQAGGDPVLDDRRQVVEQGAEAVDRLWA